MTKTRDLGETDLKVDVNPAFEKRTNKRMGQSKTKKFTSCLWALNDNKKSCERKLTFGAHINMRAMSQTQDLDSHTSARVVTLICVIS